MVPSPWHAVILTLGTYRILRLLAWDDLPPVVRAREWLLGIQWKRTGTSNSMQGLTAEQAHLAVSYKRPLLAHLWLCAFCLGFWVSLAVYLLWRFEPVVTLYLCAPFALSGAVGLVAKNWDP